MTGRRIIKKRTVRVGPVEVFSRRGSATGPWRSTASAVLLVLSLMAVAQVGDAAEPWVGPEPRPVDLAVDPCDGPGADPWVAQLRDRILNFNDLAVHAIGRYGPPSACDGSVNDNFDGAKFGVVTLSFGGDVSLTVETFPPEASIVSFSDTSGFDDEREMRELLLAYTDDVGLRVDWSIPDVRRGEGTRVETYFDAHPGMNASVALHYTDGALTQIEVKLAL